MSERIEHISALLREAADSLVHSDSDARERYLTPADLAHNPYVTDPGHDGKIEASEAVRARHPFAKNLYAAASEYAGSPYYQGGAARGFQPAIMPAYRLEYGQLRNFVVHVEAIVALLDGDGDGKLKEGEIAELPRAIEQHFRSSLNVPSQSHLTQPAFHQRVERLVRAVYAAP